MGPIAVKTLHIVINTPTSIKHSFLPLPPLFFLSADEQRRCTTQVSARVFIFQGVICFYCLNLTEKEKIIPETGIEAGVRWSRSSQNTC